MTVSERAIVNRAGAVAILVVLLGALWFGPIDLYRGQLATGDRRIAAETALLQRYRALAAPGRPVEAAPADLSLLLPDVPEAQAAALLQETIKSAAAGAQIAIRGMQVLHPQADAGAVRIGIRVSATGDIASLGRLLYAIEAARPLLYPDNLQIQARPPVSEIGAMPLEIQFDVTGFKAGGA
ncbi:MAG TPA: type II secretion system protein GspM [Stellaceae bacterium]|nr:type II secretion system protein GspM [Stellaceae bacterium]